MSKLLKNIEIIIVDRIDKHAIDKAVIDLNDKPFQTTPRLWMSIREDGLIETILQRQYSSEYMNMMNITMYPKSRFATYLRRYFPEYQLEEYITAFVMFQERKKDMVTKAIENAMKEVEGEEYAKQH